MSFPVRDLRFYKIVRSLCESDGSETLRPSPRGMSVGSRRGVFKLTLADALPSFRLIFPNATTCARKHTLVIGCARGRWGEGDGSK